MSQTPGDQDPTTATRHCHPDTEMRLSGMDRGPGQRVIGHVFPAVSAMCILRWQTWRLVLSFYCGVLGFELMQRHGREAAFVSAGGYHHHIGLNTWESKGGSPPPTGTTGLYHVAILYPTHECWQMRFAA